MDSQKEMAREDTPNEEGVLDADWFSRFAECGSFEAYEYLDGDMAQRDEAKRRFLSGEDENPTLEYPKINVEKLRLEERQLLALKADIIHGEGNEVVQQAYRWRINEKIAEIRMLLAAERGDSRRFSRYSEFIYGRPSEDIFKYTVGQLRERAMLLAENDNPNTRAAAKTFITALPAAEDNTGIAKPSAGEFQSVKKTTMDTFEDLLSIPIEGRVLKAGEIKRVFDKAIRLLNINDWKVVVDTSSKSGISADQEKELIRVPESRTVLVKKLRKLLVHELGTHVMRRVKGKRSKLRLLSLGLDRYDGGEEGVATMREQVLGDAFEDFSGYSGHLAIGLAMGIDGEKRNFREVYDILHKMYTMMGLARGKSPEKASEYATRLSWIRCVRTFRGTDCSEKGRCYTKDIVYSEGNIGAWSVVRSKPEEVMRFDVGKYDPSNPRHIWILDTLGISDDDLRNLEG